MRDEIPIEEIVGRRFGSDHEKPCAEPEIRTCALWNCQIANQCQMLPRQPSYSFKMTRTQIAARKAAELRAASEKSAADFAAFVDHGKISPKPYAGRVINPFFDASRDYAIGEAPEAQAVTPESSGSIEPAALREGE
jgi:hypothetical protein